MSAAGGEGEVCDQKVHFAKVHHTAATMPDAVFATAGRNVDDYDARLDFRSPDFDPLLALYTPGLEPPNPRVRRVLSEDTHSWLLTRRMGR